MKPACCRAFVGTRDCMANCYKPLYRKDITYYMENKNILNRIYQYICKDTGGQNESSKLIVVVRFLVLTMIVYSLISSGLCLGTSGVSGSVFCLASAALFLVIFVFSYKVRTFVSFGILNICILVWIITNINMFGWDIGVQHFIITLLIFCFFAKYKHEAAKIAYAVFLCILRLYLYHYCRNHTPAVDLSTEITYAFQIINTLAIFWSISLIAYIFSTDTQAMEGKLIEYNKQLKLQASIDPLTGLNNRRSTMDFLNRLLKSSPNQISFCLCDIDFFKRVNDTYGHDVGDVVLKKIAETFRTELPNRSFISRWGGEEFVLVFPDTNGDEANIVLESLRQKIKKIVFDGGSENFSISMTFGLVEYDFRSDLNEILKEADEKLYMGKESGRDRIIF